MDDHYKHKTFVKEGQPVSFTDEVLQQVNTLIARYPDDHKKSALIPVLHIAQEELGGHLSVDVMDYVAKILNIQPIEVYEVATFYTQFYLEKAGKYVIDICRTGPCAMCGGEDMKDYISSKLGIKEGETTADGLFTLHAVECLGACGYSPVMQINTEFYERLTKDKIDAILADLKSKANQDKPKESKWVEKFF
jgi:NADH-quinone oxidoreductase subunit E